MSQEKQTWFPLLANSRKDNKNKAQDAEQLTIEDAPSYIRDFKINSQILCI